MTVRYKAFKLRNETPRESWDTLGTPDRYTLEEPPFDDRVHGLYYLENDFSSVEEAEKEIREFCTKWFICTEFVILPIITT